MGVCSLIFSGLHQAKRPPDVDGMVALSLVTDHDDDPFKASLLCSIVVVSFYGTVSRLSFCV